MPGWKKAWLSVLDRAGGGSLQTHLQGLHSPSSSSSSLANYKRGGKHGSGHVSGKAVAGCFSVALALAFFYVSVTGGPAADDSFPSPAASSSSGILLSWLSSNASTTSPRKSLPPRPPVPPAVTAGGAADDEQSNARNATVASRRVQSSAVVGYSSASEVGSGQATSVPGQTANAQGPPWLDAGNATVGSDAEPAGNGTREEEPQVETAMPMLRWRRTDGASSSNNNAVGAQTARSTDLATGNSTDTGASTREEVTKNAAVENVQNSALQAALPSRPERKEDRHRRRRGARHRHPRRRKEITLPAAQDLVAERSDGETAGVRTSLAVGPSNEMTGVNTSMAVGPGSDMAAGVASMGVVGAGNNRIVWTSGVQDLVSFAKCDVFSGRWVRDESYGFYPPKSCTLIDDDFNCHKNGRPDSDYLKWRWQPHGCDIPRLNATEFLERLRGQRIIFVGDSLNRNMWESLVCVLRHGVRDKRNVYEASGKNQFKTRGYYSFKFREYNCSVDFIRSIFLVKEMIREGINGTEDAKLKLDELDATTPAYQTADIVVFNTGHWWTHYKTSRGGGQWNSGGRCHRETEPIFNQTYLTEYPEKMVILEQVLRQMKTPVIYLNISTLTDYRKDGHPSVYRTRYDTEEERMAMVKKQDCSHWCLPGIPDTWNELLYASLLQAGKGSWKL
ncbi:Protein trichome birefringence-like 2 [Dichanthelium oligosanthes]|uniref:Protein trichome birefringence-like 2 n=1 Tax=Dichanthelium oligosanthes TaxID=888268 RepID=A0A1E5UKB3_9POAL|nr:Protein trichome birefringence-like 2 [Dichanthelium oligosanthes]